MTTLSARRRLADPTSGPYRDQWRSSIGQIGKSPIANVLGVVTAKTSAAGAPAGGRDATAPIGVAAVELDEMVAAQADVHRVRIDRRPAAAAIGRVGAGDAPGADLRHRDRTSPCARHHGQSVPRRTSIVDRADRTDRRETGARFRTSSCTTPARSSRTGDPRRRWRPRGTPLPGRRGQDRRR